AAGRGLPVAEPDSFHRRRGVSPSLPARLAGVRQPRCHPLCAARAELLAHRPLLPLRRPPLLPRLPQDARLPSVRRRARSCAGALYLIQALLHACSCWLLFGLVVRSFGPRAAFWASLLLATDLMVAISNFEPMSEPLFLFLALASAYCLVPAILTQGDRPGRA